MLEDGSSSGLRPPALAGGCPMGMRQAARGILSSAVASRDAKQRKRARRYSRRDLLINRFTSTFRGCARVYCRSLKCAMGIAREPGISTDKEPALRWKWLKQ